MSDNTGGLVLEAMLLREFVCTFNGAVPFPVSGTQTTELHPCFHRPLIIGRSRSKVIICSQGIMWQVAATGAG
jgi:hypothetical protein